MLQAQKHQKLILLLDGIVRPVRLLKIVKPAKNTITEADYNGSLLDRTKNTLINNQADAVKEVVVQKGGGTPSFTWTRKEEQIWTASAKTPDNSFSISGSNALDPTQRGEFLAITPYPY